MQRDSDRDGHVEGLDEPDHRDPEGPGGGSAEPVVDPIVLVAEAEPDPMALGHAVTQVSQRFHAGGIRDEEVETLRGSLVETSRGASEATDVDPLVGAPGGPSGDREPLGPLDRQDLLDPEGVAGSENGPTIVGVVDPVQDDDDPTRPRLQDRLDPRRPRRRHERPQRVHDVLIARRGLGEGAFEGLQDVGVGPAHGGAEHSARHGPGKGPGAMLWLVEMGEPQRDMLVSGKYRINDPLGSGGMGAVYSATHVEVGRKVALKFLRSDLTKTPGTVARFRREASAAGSIGHENILEVFDVGEMSDGTPFIVMELLEGESLARLMSREKKLAPWRAAHIAAQMLSALGAAHHRGIVHRDLKPENVFLTTRAGQRDFVKVLDFGISAITNPVEGTPRLTQTGDVLGTPPYMAPEQARGEPVIDHRADLWAAGVVLFEMLTAQLPFPGQNGLQVISRILTEPVPRATKHVPDLSPELDAVVFKALDKDKTARFQNAPDFYEALVPFLLEGARPRPLEFTPATPVSWAVEGGDLAATHALKRSLWRRAPRPVKIAVSTAAVILAVLAGVLWMSSRPAAPRAPARGGREAVVQVPEAPPGPETVTFTVSVVPRQAEIRLDGALLEGNPASLTLRRGTAAVRLQVKAPGYTSIDRWLASDRDRSMDIALVRLEAASPPAPAEPPASAQTNAPQTTKQVRGGRGSRGGGTPPPGGRGNGSRGGGGTDIFTDLRGPR